MVTISLNIYLYVMKLISPDLRLEYPMHYDIS